ncbi:hypothetical protein [Streptomyces sp. NPDC051014]|uniref:hypothetical protein n=1 Tax=Streptomyces sp. NPDC051014 TaxID=3155751 RepID=UPI00340895C9
MRTVAAERGLNVSYDRRTVQRWLSGTRPRPPAPTLLLEGLSRALGKLVTAQEAGLSHTPALFVDRSWEASPVQKVVRLASAELNSSTGVASDAEGFSLATLYLPEWVSDEPSIRHGQRMLPETGDVQEIFDIISMFSKGAEMHGGGHLRVPVAAYLIDHVIPLLPSDVNDPDKAGLLSGAARLILLLADMCIESGRDRSAQHYQQIAVRFAASAHDMATVAAALCAMAAHACELGHRGTVVLSLAERAVVCARHASPAVRAQALAQLSVIQAQTGGREALDTLTQAEHLHQLAETEPDPVLAYSLGTLHHQRARTFIALGETTSAIRALSASLYVRGAEERCAASMAHAQIAELYAMISHFEQSVAHCRCFFSAYPTLHSARATRRFDSLCHQLRAQQHDPHVRAFLAQEEQCREQVRAGVKQDR